MLTRHDYIRSYQDYKVELLLEKYGLTKNMDSQRLLHQNNCLAVFAKPTLLGAFSVFASGRSAQIPDLSVCLDEAAVLHVVSGKVVFDDAALYVGHMLEKVYDKVVVKVNSVGKVQAVEVGWRCVRCSQVNADSVLTCAWCGASR